MYLPLQCLYMIRRRGDRRKHPRAGSAAQQEQYHRDSESVCAEPQIDQAGDGEHAARRSAAGHDQDGQVCAQLYVGAGRAV
jgi:hypothetical protein